MNALILLSEWQESQIEFWRPIVGFPHYDVSTFGNVRRWKRGQPQFSKKASPDKYGYPQVYLRDKAGVIRTRRVHTLVARAFVPNPLGLAEVNHLTALKRDSRSGNLEFTTRQGNMRHVYENGLIKNTARGERQCLAKLTDAIVRIIRERRAAGERTKVLAEEFRVDKSTIERAVSRKTWAHVT